MPSVGFMSPKGGAGKTTAALTLALSLAELGLTVAMVDADPNKPLVHWASLPGRPKNVSVHPAPTAQDLKDALRDAERHKPDWIILDTEGSIRGATAFRLLRLDILLTPLAASQIEALQAIAAADMVRQSAGRSGQTLVHRCVVTRLPAAIRPRSLKLIVDQLRAHHIDILPTPLIEKEAFRMLFTIGGDFAVLVAAGISGVDAARKNASAYTSSVMELIRERQKPMHGGVAGDSTNF